MVAAASVVASATVFGERFAASVAVGFVLGVTGSSVCALMVCAFCCQCRSSTAVSATLQHLRLVVFRSVAPVRSLALFIPPSVLHSNRGLLAPFTCDAASRQALSSEGALVPAPLGL